MNTNESPGSLNARTTPEVRELARQVEKLSAQVTALAEEIEWLKAEKIVTRIDKEEETLIPLEVLQRVIDDDVSPLKAIREWRGLTQGALAKRIGTAKNYISQLETGRRKPGRKILYRLAEALNVPPEVLLD
ncbi:helix-turn-helix domain-containing protein [Thermopetrobacter sp. TC1]|uniref:helix-turn-helix domain-containing protein n=1 Tax=Thermopetrobacter sp. TC1 TaxID=1495045 RepID=UPI00068EE313|nr:helix-turn-helix transcriptional regulator [Thermopetrobacter sp. TC1]